VGCAATQDEQPKHPEDPIEGKIAPPPHQVKQGERDAEVRNRNETVGNDVQPQDERIPKITVAVGHEAVHVVE
jgi:hypothetical protein